MVLQVGADLRLPVVVGAQQPALRVAHLAQQELRAPDGRLEIAGLLQRRAGVGECADHQRVPARQALVVKPGSRPIGAHLQQSRAHPLALLRRRARAPMPGARSAPARDGGDRRSFPARWLRARRSPRQRPRPARRAARGASTHRSGPLRLRSRRPARRRRRPPGPRISRSAQSSVSRHTSARRASSLGLETMKIGAGEQRVVVEHLLEVRNRPGRVHAVAGEAAAELVVDAAACHRAQGVQRHIALPAAQQELDHGRLRELGCAAEPSVARVVCSPLARSRPARARPLPTARRKASGAPRPTIARAGARRRP